MHATGIPWLASRRRDLYVGSAVEVLEPRTMFVSCSNLEDAEGWGHGVDVAVDHLSLSFESKSASEFVDV